VITGVAIRWGAFMVALPRPARHHDCLRAAQQIADDAPGGPFQEAWNVGKSGTQGFVDERGRFLTRKQAYAHVRRCGQPLIDGEVRGSILTSEDLW